MSFRALALTLPAMALLAGCALTEPEAAAPAPAPAAAPAAAPAPAPAANAAFDGRYRGQLVRARNAARSCRPAHAPAHATVQAGRVSLVLGRQAPLSATLDAQGAATLTGHGLTIALKASRAVLGGEASRDTCHYTLSLRKQR